MDQGMPQISTTVVTIDRFMRCWLSLWMKCRLVLDISAYVGIGSDVGVVTRECLLERADDYIFVGKHWLIV